MSFRSYFITPQKLPVVIESQASHPTLQDLLDLVAENKDVLHKHLLEAGGVLLRNFPVETPQHFAAVIKAFAAGRWADYAEGDSPRTKVFEGVYTSTEAPPSLKIPLHNELSFVKNYPKHIYFLCQTAPEEKGETILADARTIFDSIDDQVKQRWIEKGIKYKSTYFYQSKLMDLVNRIGKGHKSWPEVFETLDKAEVEKKCIEHEIDFHWDKHNWLHLSQVRPAAIVHPITRQNVWFNQVHLFDFNPRFLGWGKFAGVKLLQMLNSMRLHEVTFADGAPIPRKEIYHVMDVLDAHTVYFPWRKGDLLILDNVLAMHGRSAFSGKRRVLAAMTS